MSFRKPDVAANLEKEKNEPKQQLKELEEKRTVLAGATAAQPSPPFDIRPLGELLKSYDLPADDEPKQMFIEMCLELSRKVLHNPPLHKDTTEEQYTKWRQSEANRYEKSIADTRMGRETEFTFKSSEDGPWSVDTHFMVAQGPMKEPAGFIKFHVFKFVAQPRLVIIDYLTRRDRFVLRFPAAERAGRPGAALLDWALRSNCPVLLCTVAPRGFKYTQTLEEYDRVQHFYKQNDFSRGEDDEVPLARALKGVLALGNGKRQRQLPEDQNHLYSLRNLLQQQCPWSLPFGSEGISWHQRVGPGLSALLDLLKLDLPQEKQATLLPPRLQLSTPSSSTGATPERQGEQQGAGPGLQWCTVGQLVEVKAEDAPGSGEWSWWNARVVALIPKDPSCCPLEKVRVIVRYVDDDKADLADLRSHRFPLVKADGSYLVRPQEA